ncbi:MAG TPA: septum formation protein Maf [Candidatus Aminicenantes bacterium]|nr:septum formation protein Maf [Candidatus Aminicenantes bacterium]
MTKNRENGFTSRIVLASSSPRRLELMRLINLNPEVHPPRIPEIIRPNESPEDFVCRLTLEKGRFVRGNLEGEALVVSADTVVILDGDIVGKPGSRDHARQILCSLSGRMHEVWTGIGLLHAGREWVEMAKTRVWFAELSAWEIDRYLDLAHYQDKAGAYAIQGLSALFVERISGCYFNVMGFPLRLFYTMTNRAGIDCFGIQPSRRLNGESDASR